LLAVLSAAQFILSSRRTPISFWLLGSGVGCDLGSKSEGQNSFALKARTLCAERTNAVAAFPALAPHSSLVTPIFITLTEPCLFVSNGHCIQIGRGRGRIVHPLAQ